MSFANLSKKCLNILLICEQTIDEMYKKCLIGRVTTNRTKVHLKSFVGFTFSYWLPTLPHLPLSKFCICSAYYDIWPNLRLTKPAPHTLWTSKAPSQTTSPFAFESICLYNWHTCSERGKGSRQMLAGLPVLSCITPSFHLLLCCHLAMSIGCHGYSFLKQLIAASKSCVCLNYLDKPQRINMGPCRSRSQFLGYFLWHFLLDRREWQGSWERL